MSQAQLSKLWSVITAFLLYYTLNSWIIAQGGNELFGAHLIVSGKVPAVMLAIPICSVIIIISSIVGGIYARRSSDGWQGRIPLFGFESINTKSRDGTTYQAAIIIIFSAIPLLSLVYFWVSFLKAPVMLNDGTKQLIRNVWDWSKLTTLNDPARICTDFNKDLPDPCVGNGTVLPGLEPTIFAILTAIAALAAIRHWYDVFYAAKVAPNV